jgi:hypothetical protein
MWMGSMTIPSAREPIDPPSQAMMKKAATSSFGLIIRPLRRTTRAIGSIA